MEEEKKEPSTLLVVDLADMDWAQHGNCGPGEKVATAPKRPEQSTSTSTAAEGGRTTVQVVSRTRDLADLGYGAWAPTALPLFDAPYFPTGPVAGKDGKRSAVAPPNVISEALAALTRHRQQTQLPLLAPTRTEEHARKDEEEAEEQEKEEEEEEATPPCTKKRRRCEPEPELAEEEVQQQQQQQIRAPPPQGPPPPPPTTTTTTTAKEEACPGGVEAPVETQLLTAPVNSNTNSGAPAPPSSGLSSSSSSTWPSLKAHVKTDGEALVAWVALGESLQRFRQASDEEPPFVDAQAVTGADTMMGCLVRNDRDGPTLLTAFPDRTFIVPARSAFLLSDIQSMLYPLLHGDVLINGHDGHAPAHVMDTHDHQPSERCHHHHHQHQHQHQHKAADEEEEQEKEKDTEEEEEEEDQGTDERGFSLVVMDPPWENRSLARSGNYGTLAPHEIAKLPLRPLLSAHGAYVVVWVTNNPALHNFVRRKLFPRWRLQFVATHYWLKLTSAGEPVMPVHSAHRKPYEPFMVGYYDGGTRDQAASTPPPQLLPLMQLREQMVVCSTANRHARKPCLDDVLGLPPCMWGLKKLELFARNLRAGWTSWGNQVLLFQELKHFSPLRGQVPEPSIDGKKDLQQ